MCVQACVHAVCTYFILSKNSMDGLWPILWRQSSSDHTWERDPTSWTMVMVELGILRVRFTREEIKADVKGVKFLMCCVWSNFSSSPYVDIWTWDSQTTVAFKVFPGLFLNGIIMIPIQIKVVNRDIILPFTGSVTQSSCWIEFLIPVIYKLRITCLET